MALQSSGEISLLDVRNELDASGAISLGSSSVRDLAGVSSGSISLGGLYGKSGFTTTHVLTVDKSDEAYGYYSIDGYNDFGSLSPNTVGGAGVRALQYNNNFDMNTSTLQLHSSIGKNLRMTTEDGLVLDLEVTGSDNAKYYFGPGDTLGLQNIVGQTLNLMIEVM